MPRSRRRTHMPQSSIPEPRPRLIAAALDFVLQARLLPGIRRIALIGSLTTPKAVPKDVDMLVSIDPGMDLGPLAQLGRRLEGAAQTINLGADIFLDEGRYIGRICRFRRCHPRASCRAESCARRQHLNDDLYVVRLAAELVGTPPVELWPRVVVRIPLPPDIEAGLIAKL